MVGEGAIARSPVGGAGKVAPGFCPVFVEGTRATVGVVGVVGGVGGVGG